MGWDVTTCITGTEGYQLDLLQLLIYEDLGHMSYIKLVRKHLVFLNMHSNYTFSFWLLAFGR